MPYHGLSASKIARIVGCHPNTVRKYEEWGLIPPVPRNLKGYRQYSQFHLDQMKLARTAFNTPFPGSKIRKSTYTLVKTAGSGDLGGALSCAYAHLALVRAEIAQSEAVVELVRYWISGNPVDANLQPLRIGQVARLLDVSTDMLRNWESNDLLSVPRAPHSGYRLYSQAEIARLRIIRMLRTAGYSVLSILRMLHQLDRGSSASIQDMLDTVPDGEEIEYATDRWIHTLHVQEETTKEVINMLTDQINRRITHPTESKYNQGF